MPLSSLREALPGVECIYLLSTPSIPSLLKDIDAQLYQHSHLNFLDPLDDNSLDRLAAHVAMQPTNPIQSIHQHHLLFQSLSPRLFSANQPDCYQNAKSLVTQLAHSLFGVLSTLQTAQCSIFSWGDTAHATATTLQNMLSAQENTKEDSRTAVIILDRAFDLGVAMLHPWHYGALLHDLLGIQNNKVSAQGVPPFDLDTQSDSFWAEKISTPFPYVACDLEKELNDWKDNYEAMAHKKQFDNAADMSVNLSSALDQLPEMSEKKKRIDSHTSLATDLLNSIKTRQLDQCFEIGQALLTNKSLPNHLLKDLQVLAQSCQSQDLLRLLIIAFLSCKQVPPAVQALESRLQEKDKETLKHFKQSQGMDTAIQAGANEKEEKTEGSKKGYMRLLSKMKDQGQNVISLLQNSMSDSTTHKVTKTVENILQNNWGLIEANFQYIEGRSGRCLTNVKGIFEDYQGVVVFYPDGGCYNELHNLASLEKEMSRPIYYGGGYVYNANQLLGRL